MAELPFPLGYSGTEKLPRTRQTLVNCWNGGDKIINRPGITELNDTGKKCRGVFEWRDHLYQVVSKDLIKITTPSTGNYSVIGTIAGSEDVDVAVGFTSAAIVVKGGNAYTLDENDVLTQIVDVDFVPSVSVSFMNSRWQYIPADGSVAFFSEVGAAGDIDPLSFFDAEQLPDKNSVCFNLGNYLYIGGTDSFEMFKDSGIGTVPYVRMNARIDYGYIGGKLEYTANGITTYLFVGRKGQQVPGIFAISQGQAIRISNELIDTALATYTTEELKDVKANRLIWLGYDVATFKLPNHAFGFENGNWFELTTQVNNESMPWDADHFAEFQGKYYVGDGPKIGVFEDVPGDYGNTFEKRIDLGFEQDRDFAVNSLELNISQGYNAEIGSVSIQLSHDNVLYGPPFAQNTGDIGEYSNRLIWEYPGGLGYYYGFMGLRIISTENINLSATKIVIDQ